MTGMRLRNACRRKFLPSRTEWAVPKDLALGRVAMVLPAWCQEWAHPAVTPVLTARLDEAVVVVVGAARSDNPRGTESVLPGAPSSHVLAYSGDGRQETLGEFKQPLPETVAVFLFLTK